MPQAAEGSGLGVEAVGQAAAVDVEGFEDLQDGFDRDAPGVGPADDVEVFLAGFEAIEDAIKEEGFVVEAAFEEAEVAAVEFDPEAFALQVLQPPRPQVTPPVTLDPTADGRLAQVTAGLLTLNPFKAQCLLLPFRVDAGFFHESTPHIPCPARSSTDVHVSLVIFHKS